MICYILPIHFFSPDKSFRHTYLVVFEKWNFKPFWMWVVTWLPHAAPLEGWLLTKERWTWWRQWDRPCQEPWLQISTRFQWWKRPPQPWFCQWPPGPLWEWLSAQSRCQRVEVALEAPESWLVCNSHWARGWNEHDNLAETVAVAPAEPRLGQALETAARWLELTSESRPEPFLCAYRECADLTSVGNTNELISCQLIIMISMWYDLIFWNGLCWLTARETRKTDHRPFLVRCWASGSWVVACRQDPTLATIHKENSWLNHQVYQRTFWVIIA